MKNKDIVFYSFIVVWMLIILITGDRFRGSPYWFVGTAAFLLVLRLTVLRNWWDNKIKKS